MTPVPNSDDKLIQLAAYSFDAAVMDIYGALLNGASLYPFDLRTTSLAACVDWLEQQQVTIYHSTPSVYRHLISVLKQPLEQVRLVVLGGEIVIQADVENYQGYFNKHCLFINGLGPTESTITVQYFLNQQTPVPRYRVPVGYPVAETDLLLLNENGEFSELYGEIIFRSPYLALGYWQRDSSAFSQSPNESNKRCYRTGDIGRLLSNGALEVIGRRDHQLKLRGFRIELGEIETTLTQHEAVREAVVVLIKDESNPCLAAYLTLAIPIDDVSSLLRTWLKARLPDYMIPVHFMSLEQLPLTPNGKIDRKALPAPDALTKSQHYQAPRDPVELQMKQIWENVLEVRPIGIFENFFELGGHSLLAVRLMSQIHQAFDKQLHIASLFQAATIAELAQLIRHNEAPTWPILIPIQPQGRRPPLFCFPGAGGNVLYLHSLAAYLGKDQPCYGLQPSGLDGKSITPSSIEALAARNLKELLKVQPQGPYFLAGHSFGGIVAFELACQLEQQGETVALLAILETSAPTSKIDDDTVLMNETDWLWKMVKILEELTETKLGLEKEMLQSQATLAQSYELIMQSLKQHGIFFAPTAESDQLKAMVDTYKANHHAHIHYQPQGPIKAPIVLFRAEEQFKETSSMLCEDWDWNQYTSGNVIVRWVPGTHITMLNEPHVKQLATQLRSYLHSSTNST